MPQMERELKSLVFLFSFVLAFDLAPLHKTRKKEAPLKTKKRENEVTMLSSLLSGLGGVPFAAAAAAAAPSGGEEEERREVAKTRRQRRASGSFSGGSGGASSPSSSAPPSRRPLVIEWPQVKAFLAMADASLRRKTELVEVRERKKERKKERKHGGGAGEEEWNDDCRLLCFAGDSFPSPNRLEGSSRSQ